MITTITFEDHWQDFLTWEVDGKGKVVSCKPFQEDIWNKWRVLNKTFEVGDYVLVKKGKETLTIKYPIAAIAYDKMRPAPRTFAGWQKIFPDALKVAGTCSGIMTPKEAKEMLYGQGVDAKMLANNSATSFTKKGTTTRFCFIFSKLAHSETLN